MHNGLRLRESQVKVYFLGPGYKTSVLRLGVVNSQLGKNSITVRYLARPAANKSWQPHTALRPELLNIRFAEIHRRPPGFDHEVCGAIPHVVISGESLVSEQRQRALCRSPIPPGAFGAKPVDCAGLGVKRHHEVRRL